MADLRRLNELDDYTVAPDDPDPRGWRIASSDGRDVGLVKDLIVDTVEMKARYLDVEVDRTVSPDRDRRVLVPTEAVSVGDAERRQRRIVVTDARADALAREPNPSADWGPAAADACTVRVTRGGGRG
jgi:photosynthetic reaction center H subunit